LVSPQGRLRAGWRAALFVLLALAVFTTFMSALNALHQSPRLGDYLPYPDAWWVMIAALLGTHWTLLRFVDRTGWRYVDLSARAARARPLALGFLSGALAIGIPSLLLLAAGWFALLRAPHGDRVWVDTTTSLLVLVPAALAEELMVRGYLLSALADGMGRWAAIVTTSVLFAALHLGNPNVSPIALIVVALAGVFLAVVRYATASLYAAWAAHLAWNATIVLLMHAVVSGQGFPTHGWATYERGPDWITGGGWGPEGGMAAALGLAAATTLLLGRRRRALATNTPNAPLHA
jgi:membrane protease YdiL (CAAX protease family)